MVRIIAAITSVVLLGLVVWVAVAAWTGDDRLIMPTDGVIGVEGGTDLTGAAYDALVQRGELQRWRGEAGPAPGEAGQAAISPPEPAEQGTDGDLASSDATAPVPQSSDLVVQSWLSRADDEADLLQEPRFIEGASSLPGPVVDVFEQPQGRAWRALRNETVYYGGALYIFGLSALIAIFLAARGRIPMKEEYSGETVERFGLVERANHWMTASSFLVMALTGLVILYGASLIRPWLGADAFGTLSEWSAWLHMVLIVPFVLGIVMMIALWTWGNLPTRLDWHWLKQGGGFLSDTGANPPARRFNAGQKIVFWGVVIGGLVLTVSGITMMFPFLWAGYVGMQTAQTVHAVTALLMVGLIIGHIYIGTVGMEGAFEAMWSGHVDRNWAKEHHAIWYDRINDRGERRSEPAE